MRHAAIIGGGIGGLTAALALRGHGWRVSVYEQAGSIDPVGSGLAVAPNALRALDTIGVGDEVRRLSSISGAGGIRRSNGRWLNRINAEALGEAFGDPTVMLPRAALVEQLVGRIDPADLCLGVRVEAVDPDRGLVTTNRGESTADLIVAADGIRSRVRGALFPRHPEPVYSGGTAWRVIVPDPGRIPQPAEYWGRGAAVGIFPLADGRVYLYAMAIATAGGHAPDDERAELLRRFASWASPIPELLTGTDPARVLRNDMYYLKTPLPALHSGKVAILGDAAHAMTPNLGQGACMAIEDAVTLAHEVTRGHGLAGYTRSRLPRTSMMVAQSATVGRITLVRNPFAVAARDAGMWLAGRLGTGPALRKAAQYYDWRPPVSGVPGPGGPGDGGTTPRPSRTAPQRLAWGATHQSGRGSPSRPDSPCPRHRKDPVHVP